MAKNLTELILVSSEFGEEKTAKETEDELILKLANEVIAGKWGDYPERKEKLEKAGYSYEKVQAKVNELLKAGSTTTSDTSNSTSTKKSSASSSSSSDGTASTSGKLTKTSNETQIATKSIRIILQANSQRDVQAEWSYEYKNDKGTNLVKSYTFDWMYQTAASSAWIEGVNNGSVDYPASATLYSTPSDATKVRFRIKPISKTYKKDKEDKNYFDGKVSSWVTFSGFIFKATPKTNQVSLKTKKKDGLDVVFTSAARPYVTASWPADSSEYVDHYDYKWEYYNPDTLKWEEAETGSTPKLTDSDRKNKTTQSVRMYVQTGASASQPYLPTYTQVRFTVIAVPTDGSQGTVDGSGAFTFVEQSDTCNIKFETPEISDLSLTYNFEDGMIYAVWDGANNESVASYDIEWQVLSGAYHFFNQSAVDDQSIWLPGGTGNVVATETATSKKSKDDHYVFAIQPTVISVTMPDGSVVQKFHDVRVRIKPKCDDAQAFIEDWSKWKTISYDIPTFSIPQPVLSRPQYLNPRYVEAKWTTGELYSDYKDVNIASFTYEWAYQMKGASTVHVLSSGSVDFGASQWDTSLLQGETWATSTTAPSEAYVLLFRVKAEPSLDYAFSGSWTEYESITFGEAQPVKVSDLHVGLYNAQSRTLFARWSMPEGLIGTIALYEKLANAATKTFNDGTGTYSVWQLVALTQSTTEEDRRKAIYLIEKDLITSYEVNWKYFFKDTWFTGSSTNVSGATAYTGLESDLTYTATYNVPEEAKEVSVSIRPNSAVEDFCVGQWCERVTQSITPLVVDLEAGSHITVDWYPEDDRTLVGRAIPTLRCIKAAQSKSTNVDEQKLDLIFEWTTYRYGAWETAYTESVEIIDDIKNFAYNYSNQTNYSTMSTYSVPQNAQKVRLRVKPDVNNYSYIGEWSDYVYFNVMIPTRKVKNLDVALRRGTERTLVATWDPPEDVIVSTDDNINQLDSYTYKWQYNIDGVWFDGDEGSSSTDSPACTYDAPDDASIAQVRVMPVPTKSQYFTGEWTSYVPFDIDRDTYPYIPDVPTLEVVEGDPYTFRARVEVYDRRASRIEFQIVDETGIWRQEAVSIILNRATFQFPVVGGHAYRARCTAINSQGEYAREWYEGSYITPAWSNYSNELASLPPPLPVAPKAIAITSNSAEVTWQAPTTGTVTSYTVEYAKKGTYFDAAPDQVRNTQITSGTRALITDLDASEWFFRVCSNNAQGSSDWSSVVSVILGAIPTAPTTWSNRTSAVINEEITLYWTHNCADESKESSAQLEIYIGGKVQTVTVTPSTDPDDPYAEQETSHYTFPAGSIKQETTIEWRARTKGVMPDYGPWSTQRIIKVYSPPTITLRLSDSPNWSWDSFNFNEQNIYTNYNTWIGLRNNVLTTFPLMVMLDAKPASQTPTSYILSVKSNNAYEEIDDTGFTRRVVIGQEIYKRYYNTNQKTFITLLTPDLVSFENGMSYTMTATVAMDSGLSAETSIKFRVNWIDADYDLGASIGYNPDTLTCRITPYAFIGDRFPTTIMLSVFRRDFDGGVTKIADKIRNGSMVTVVDPHPSLDFARYRIVGQSTATGTVNFEDMGGLEIGETSIIIQWDEQWQSYDENAATEDAFAERPWNGSMLKLPYNITVSDSNTVDVENIEYIGRKHPVSYYGTQVGQKATWTAEIPKADKETIYGLRRLAVYMGNVYVREPYGSGYWANIAVSFNISYNSMVVPVTLDVTRVEGGM